MAGSPTIAPDEGLLDVIDLLTEVVGAFSAAQDLETVAVQVERTIDRLIEVQHSGLYFWDANQERMRLLFARGFSDDERRDAERTAWYRHPGAVFRSQQMLHVPDTARDEKGQSQSSRRSFCIRSRLYMPVVWRGESIAVLGLASREPDAFNEAHIYVLRFVCRLTGVVYGQIHDRNARVRAQTHLSGMAERLQMVLAGLPIALVAVDATGQISLAQGAALEQFERVEHGVSVAEGFADAPEVLELLEKTKPEQSNVENVRRDDHVLEVRCQQSQESSTILLFHDVTEQQLAIERLEELNQELAGAHDQALVANRTKSEFLATMSHELRTPLNAIIGYAELLRDELQGPPTALEDLDRILNSGRNLLHLINDILDLSKVESGRVIFHIQPLDIEGMIRSVEAELAPLCAKRNNRMQVFVDQLTTVQTDPDALRRVLINLLGNAIKFTHEGWITVRATRSHKPGQFEFEVEDSGIGMTQDELSRVFAPFTQADGSTSRRYGGTGLGLTITRHLIEQLGGSIHVSSYPQQGSTFRVTLPGVPLVPSADEEE
ncbi:MAG: ATP-binding protein [Myxococcota bacterium]